MSPPSPCFAHHPQPATTVESAIVPGPLLSLSSSETLAHRMRLVHRPNHDDLAAGHSTHHLLPFPSKLANVIARAHQIINWDPFR